MITVSREIAKAFADTFLGVGNLPHPNAAIFFKAFRKYCRVDRDGIVVSPVQKMTDPYATAYQAGRRDAFNFIEQVLRLHLEPEKDHGRRDSSIDE